MAVKVELNNQALIPREELELFKLTRCVELPWVNPVSYWVPTHADIKAIAGIARAIADKPTVLDVGCGDAFISYLLAQEVPVLGIDPNEELLAITPYRHPDLELITGTAENATELLGSKSIDVVINSWMPEGVDLSESLYALNPKTIIFVRDALGVTGTREAYEQKNGYHRAIQWGGITTAELAVFFDDICQELERKPYEFYMTKPHKYYTVDEATNHERWKTLFRRDIQQVRIRNGIAAYNIIDVRLRSDVPTPQFPFSVKGLSPYPWENDLQHILLNIHIRNQVRGFPLHPPIFKSE